jgi:peptidoglycan/LPS O-acetylase OafA/YrhL
MIRAGRIPELDGLRGIAILLVLFSHYCSNFLPGQTFFGFGVMGVEVFFVLSGFLIGGIILDGQGQRRFLISFYFRRAARIIPIYYLVVAAAFAAQTMTFEAPWMLHDRLLPAQVYLSFTTNIAFVRMHLPIGGMLIPTWTLAVEEQFYLCAPLLIMLTPRRSLPAILVLTCAAAIGFRLFFRSNESAVELLLPCRMDALAIGVGAALAQRRSELSGRHFQLLLAAGAALALLLILAFANRAVGYLLAPSLVPLSAALVMLAAINGASFGVFLRAAWLRFFGEISYGLYLVHQPILILMTGVFLGVSIYSHGIEHIQVAIVAAVVSIALATLSWHYYERPIIHLVKSWASDVRKDTITT